MVDTAQRLLAEVRDYAQLVQALRARIDELGVAGETIDDVAGLPTRYTTKLLAPIPIKSLGRVSLGPLLGALGLKLIVAEDAEALARIRHRLTPRKNTNGRLPATRTRRRGRSPLLGNSDW